MLFQLNVGQKWLIIELRQNVVSFAVARAGVTQCSLPSQAFCVILARAAAKETRRKVDLIDIFSPLFPYIID